MNRSRLKMLLPVATLLAGAGVAAALIVSRRQPERVERPALGPLVVVEPAAAAGGRVRIDAQGEVRPQVRVTLAPQVTGRVVEVHRALRSGGRFRAGTTLLRIDPRDYQLAVERSRAAVAAAETALTREQAESEAARAEWREIHGDAEPPPLLARTPQVREAQARLAAAEADLSAAQLALERTALALPFDGLVVEESVDVGQLLSVGQNVATVFGTAAVEIRVPLDDGELAWLEPPGDAGRLQAPATVEAAFAGGRHRWPGRVERMEGQVDPRSRMVHLVVVVDQPFAGRDGRPPLYPGTFVSVAIEGREMAGAVAIPRHALHADDRVWVAAGGRLEVRAVEVLRRDRDRALIGAGLAADEAVVVSALDAVTDGMAIRVQEAAGDA